MILVMALDVPLAGGLPVSAATIAYPDMKVDVPPAEISIGHPTANTRELRFSHVTWNAGAGPWEFRPTYNSNTGFATIQQALYSLSGSAQWTFDHPISVGTAMRRVAPSDYEFPMARFGLYSVASDG